ncbi:MAG: helix-turn-helix domain-containing protein [Deltaproteobacteria bacterium]|nr:helix-turn-helix domain-containing protein [Deltaproteobacteria bacterium]
MKSITFLRNIKGLSQRNLARQAGISFRSVQLLESDRHDPQISTLQKVASAIGYPVHAVQGCLNRFFYQPPESIAIISEWILEEGEESWRGWIPQFVDTFRKKRDPRYIEEMPASKTAPKIKALLASTVEALCAELELPPPDWIEMVVPLTEPWFVSGVESLKASALVESPVFFRKRNIFVLGNFLDRV